MSGSRSGFTLLEVMAAVALLGLGLGIIYGGYLQGVNLEAKYAGTGTALALARAKLAEAAVGAETDVQGVCPGAPGHSWRLERTPGGTPGLTRLAVTVSWGGDRPRSVTVWTMTGAAP